MLTRGSIKLGPSLEEKEKKEEILIRVQSGLSEAVEWFCDVWGELLKLLYLILSWVKKFFWH
jgi:hypothetical protein